MKYYAYRKSYLGKFIMKFSSTIILLHFLFLPTATRGLVSDTFSYYDKIRQSQKNNETNNVIAAAIFNNPNYVGRNLHKVRVYYDDLNNNNIFGEATIAPQEEADRQHHDSLLFCHMPIFLRYSNDLSSSCQIAYSASAGALLAIHHFNTGDASVVAELDGINERCNIRLTTEIVNTASSPISAVRDLTRMFTRSSSDFGIPQPCAVFGSQISSVTSKLSSLTGVFDLFQVSSSAMSTELENPLHHLSTYPLIIMLDYIAISQDVAGFGEMSISYLKENLGINNFGLLFPNDAYGIGFSRSVLEAAAGYDGMKAVSAQYLPTLTSKKEIDANIKLALDSLKRSGCNYIIAAFYPEIFETIMGMAYEMDLAGPGKFWLISGTADLAPITLGGKFIVEKDSNAAKAISGNGIIFCKGGLPGVGGSYDKFTREWSSIGEVKDVLDYINQKQPPAPSGDTNCAYEADFFQSLPHHIVTFTYDAVIGLGLAACASQQSMTADDVFSGKNHRDYFANNTFRGSSGDFILRPDFPTRTADSSYFVMVNMAENPVNNTHISYKGSMVSFFWDTESRSWQKRGERPFEYSDGGSIPPLEFEPRHEVSAKEVLFWPVLLVAVLFSAFVCVGAMVYVRRKRKQVDSVWNVKIEELRFDEPPEIVGRGTFGLVLLANYRGTEVAVKRVLPSKTAKLMCGVESRKAFDSRVSFVDEDEWEEHGKSDLRNSFVDHRKDTSRVRFEIEKSSLSSKCIDLEAGKEENGQKNVGVVSSGSPPGSGVHNEWSVSKVLMTLKLTDEHACMKKEFVREMRLLSKLRHPCIITVMGAVLDNIHEPMLIMEYMNHGSLYDLLHNRTMKLAGELVLPVLRDISQGLRFLHNANPAVIHSDLKAANVLIDGKFLAKVADFGLSQKKRLGGGGTPYWMAPELLRGESGNTKASDVYSFGIILFEVYSRQDPYAGEDYDSVIAAVKDPAINKRPSTPVDCPSQIKSLIDDCVHADADVRPSFDEIDERLRRLDAEIAEPADLSSSMQIKKERVGQRSVELLFEVFPRHIAEALQNGQKVEPTVRDTVTIFFSDIVGFTVISSTLSPIKISDMLDRLYNSFDQLSHIHDIFKVETIGDAYMAVTNLVKDQSDHAKRIAAFSIDAIKAANTTLIDVDDPSRGFVEIRVGFHSGPCVANVVGSRSPRYCLFGDTVNTASRMESNSMANRIHCSERSADLLREQDPNAKIIPRGWINVKGKGDMKTFWIEKSDSPVEYANENVEGTNKNENADSFSEFVQFLDS